MTRLQLALTERFENHPIDVYRDENGGIHLTREQIGEILGYSDPASAIEVIHRRNKDFLDKFSTPVKLTGVDGKIREHTVYSFKGFMAICRYSNQPVADRVMEFLIDLADRLRTGTLTPSHTLDHLARRLESIEHEVFSLRKIIDFYENSDDLFDFDYVAAAISKYMKPPFGVKHLCKWLAKRGVLTTRAYKNDRPIQTYIDRGWFEARNHSWRQHGKSRHTQIYWFTARGLNGVIRMAIEEKMLLLPTVPQAVFPALVDRSETIRAIG